MIEHLFISSSYVHFILTDLKCHGSLTSQALEIIFEVQRKRRDKKITTRKNKLSNLQNTIFFPSSSYVWSTLTFKPYNFLIHYSFK